MNDVLKNLIVAIVSFLLAFVGQYYYHQEQLKIKKLDVHQEFETGFISKPKFPNSKIVFKIGDDDLEQVGKFYISVINYSDKVYEDIPILIKLTPKDSKNFKVQAHSAVGEKGISDLVTEAKKMAFDGESYNFSYIVDSINRAEKGEYAFQLRILFEGNEKPDIDVVVKGVGTREFDNSNSPYQKELTWKAAWSGIGIFVTFILLTVAFTWFILTPIISRMTVSWDIKNNKKYAQSIFNAIKDENLQPTLSDDELRIYVAKMLYRRQKNWWDGRSVINKWSLGFVEPRFDDYDLSS
ncbi:hypothetical protein [Vibrio vulnificus]|uniref:hypothetical protein n=1 Tax=Vibrio vulnificus TaxID=672 RepID=UPI003D9CAF8B